MARTFESRMFDLGRRLEINVERLVEDFAVTIGATLVHATPVASGFARSNWVATKGSIPDLSVRGIRSASATIAEIRNKVRGAGSGPVSISNGSNKVPYLMILDRGSSSQAPTGFVRQAAVAGALTASLTTLFGPTTRRP